MKEPTTQSETIDSSAQSPAGPHRPRASAPPSSPKDAGLSDPIERTDPAPAVEELTPVYEDGHVAVYLDECLRVLRSIPDASVHSVVCDPPYAIGARPVPKASSAAPRPGDEDIDQDTEVRAREGDLMRSQMLGMQSANWHERATHSRGYADNDSSRFAAWCALWVTECLRILKPGGHLVAFGGARTWHRLAAAAEDAGFEIRDSLVWFYATGFPKSMNVSVAIEKSIAVSDAARATAHEWEGWGTTLKPAHEPIVLARKPLNRSVAETVTVHGTGALNIAAARIDRSSEPRGIVGRWPTNVFMDHNAAEALDETASGPVSRFFWVAKPGASERPNIDGVAHPTVKPLTLMRQLVRLVTPPGGTVVDPFAGSGTTVEACIIEGFDVVAVELEPTYIPLIRHRIERRLDPVRAIVGEPGEETGLFDLFDEPA